MIGYREMTRLWIILFLVLVFVSRGVAENSEYQLSRGETLYRVSKKLGIPLDLLISLNGIKDVTKVKAGTKLIIPGVHIVKKGETLYGISRMYHVRLEDILELNRIDKNYTIKPGEKLFIPLSKLTDSKTGVRVAKPSDGDSKEGISNRVSSKDSYDTSIRFDRNNNRNNVLGIAKNKGGIYWPIEGEITRVQGKIVGVKIKGKTGSKIFSVSSGRVIWSNPYKGYGEVVFIESKDGYIYGYLGNNRLLVKVGEIVARGSEIGVLGNGAGKFSSLLFIVYKNGKPVDAFKAPRL